MTDYVSRISYTKEEGGTLPLLPLDVHLQTSVSEGDPIERMVWGRCVRGCVGIVGGCKRVLGRWFGGRWFGGEGGVEDRKVTGEGVML